MYELFFRPTRNNIKQLNGMIPFLEKTNNESTKIYWVAVYTMEKINLKPAKQTNKEYTYYVPAFALINSFTYIVVIYN